MKMTGTQQGNTYFRQSVLPQQRRLMMLFLINDDVVLERGAILVKC